MARPTADDGAERLRQESLRLHARLDDLEAEVYQRGASGAGARVYRGQPASRGYSSAFADGPVSAPTRAADAAGVLLRGVSIGLIRQLELGIDVMGSFADAILGRRPADPFVSQRSRRTETSERLGRWRE